ncbi:two-component sensor histidine kinase [Streptomyces capoamus]|uniref:Two-component sensor histidine kinase n=1 Tax=Streptomyces capoamus TaxID=68183 RepID=A0A919C3Z9_9ACTN|nr:histidine kinase [Streptomyces capoamus]GGW19315.1 two-component sensor histidine kinase [Streptomyces libani subsp. rufus]GHG47605.1 two-component sensor histidine kinase [Streptomyces capoamus]
MTEDRRTGQARPEHQVRIGQGPRNRRELMVKVLWIGVWLVFLSSPVKDLASGRHTPGATAGGAIGLAAFVTAYLTLVFRNIGRPFSPRFVVSVISVLAVLAPLLSYTLGGAWLGLFVYLSVACGATLPVRAACWSIPAATAVMYLVGLRWHEEADDTLLLVPLIGFAMVGVGQLVRTTIELRKARATVAQLAANEERLRLARDLHDLLGHSLSLITLKSELAGRMLPDHPGKAAQQVADIEQVSRQALVDVREAVTGYRRPRLAAELAGAQVALTAAGVTAEVPADPDLAGVPEEAESALAWALREAVTNVVRHSGAEHCAVQLLHRQTLDGPVLELCVEDDGGGGSGTGPGNGLTGLTERLEKAGGTLEASRVKRGFRLVARVPTATGPDVGSRA